MRAAVWGVVVILVAVACGGSSSTGNGNTGSVPDAGGDTGATPDAGDGTGATPDAGDGTGATPDAGGGTGATPDAGGGTGSTTPDAGGIGSTMFALTVTVMGSGHVVSTPAGIDCPGACTMSFADGTQISLAATAQSGTGLTGFTGACSGSNCAFTLTANASVTATFAATVPPADECTGLLPASLPPPTIPDLACNGDCVKGDSDDGEGNFALLSDTDRQFGAALWTLFQIRDGKVVLQKGLEASNQSGLSVFSQPSGFSLLDSGPDDNSLLSYTNAGVNTHSTGLGNNGVSVAIDPSGGFSAVTNTPRNDGSNSFTFGRYDKGGALIAGGNDDLNGPADVIFSGNFLLFSAGMTLSHHTLSIMTFNNGLDSSFAGVWVDENGKKIGEPITPPRGGTLQFLLDGSLLQRTASAFTDIWPDGASAPSPLPSWLQARASASWLYPIRHGAGYAMGGTCSGVEVLSKNGKSCGCLAVPGVSATTSIGRDGSLIVPRVDSYELYPLLFR
jgi:hypothetical protein